MKFCWRYSNFCNIPQHGTLQYQIGVLPVFFLFCQKILTCTALFDTVFGFLFSKVSNKNTGNPKIGLPVCLFHAVRVFDTEE